MTSESSDEEKYLKESLRQASERSDWQSAFEHARALARMHPHEARPRYNLGVVLMKMGRMEEACWAFKHALDMEADYEKARHALDKCKRILSERNVPDQQAPGRAAGDEESQIDPRAFETGPFLDDTKAMEKENAIRQAVLRQIARDEEVSGKM